MKLYLVRVVKEDGRRFTDMYCGWFYKRVRYERIKPCFKGIGERNLFGVAIEVKNVQEMKECIAKESTLHLDD